MRKTYVAIVLFGIILAALAISLQLLEYRYRIRNLSTDVYTAVVATIFTVIGIWMGINLLKKKSNNNIKPTEIDSSKIKEYNLNTREYEVLTFISKGYTNQEIADKLFLALPTIKTHVSNLYFKLDVKNRTQAIHKAKSINLI